MAAPELKIEPAAIFAADRLIALPTETVYGLAAPIDRPDLVTRVFELKGRPASNPLIVHVGSLDQARACVSRWPDLAQRLAERFWPGPLTLVLPRSEAISELISAGQPTVALRMPDHPLALAVLRASPAPLVAPSANLFTRLSPTTAEDVRAVFSAADVEVIDGGPCRVGVESTIIAIDEPARQVRWLRPGLVSRMQIRACLPPGWALVDKQEAADAGVSPVAPGQFREHYRPALPLTVRCVADQSELEALGAELEARPGLALVELPDDPVRAAQQLYRRLRQAEQGAATALTMLIQSDWLADPAWEAVINRLRKAASVWQAVADNP